LKLSFGQEAALAATAKWYKDWKHGSSKPFFYLGGYAGTGKTTIESAFTDTVSGRVIRAAYTGKAALRMQQISGKQASTVHSIAYRLLEDGSESGKVEPKFELNLLESPIIGARLLVLDECSFINEEMGEDLLKFKVPILVLGDPGQLPPPKGNGYFTNRKPDAMLTEVHRQALDSPIIRIATEIRNGKSLGRCIEPGAKIYPLSKDFDYTQELLLADQILTGTNKVRLATNDRVRDLLGYTDAYPVVGDKLICLKNQRKLGLFNGLSATVEQVRHANEDVLLLDLDTEIGKRKEVDILPVCFTDREAAEGIPYRQKAEYSEFDYGYCITVHKSQGSQWNNVLILDDGHLSWKKDERAKWLYTAVTRAAESLTVLKR